MITESFIINKRQDSKTNNKLQSFFPEIKPLITCPAQPHIVIEKINNRFMNLAKKTDQMRELHEQYPKLAFTSIYDKELTPKKNKKVVKPSKIVSGNDALKDRKIHKLKKSKTSIIYSDLNNHKKLNEKQKNYNFNTMLYFKNFKKEETKYLMRENKFVQALKSRHNKQSPNILHKTVSDDENLFYNTSEKTKTISQVDSNFFLTIDNYNITKTDNCNTIQDTTRINIPKINLKNNILNTINTNSTDYLTNRIKKTSNINNIIEDLLYDSGQIDKIISCRNKEEIDYNIQRKENLSIYNDKVLILDINKIPKDQSVFVYGSKGIGGAYLNNQKLLRDYQALKLMSDTRAYQESSFLNKKFNIKKDNGKDKDKMKVTIRKEDNRHRKVSKILNSTLINKDYLMQKIKNIKLTNRIAK